MTFNNFFLTLVLLSNATFLLHAGDRVTDSLILVDLYNATNGAEWDSTWNLTDPMTKWYGINISSGRVGQIKLQNNNLAGTIPASLGALDRLSTLILRDNKLKGIIPEEIGNLTNLSFLALYSNELEGRIPESFKNLINLNHLQLFRNKLSGPLPTDLSGLTKLRGLIFSNNQLTGLIPEYIYELSSLENLSLHNNNLSGKISPSIKNLVNLTSLSLNDNQLSGNLPAELGSLPFLRSINIDENQFSGPIPNEIGNLDSLGSFKISNNSFSSIPQSLNDIHRLYYVQASNNKLTSIPDFDPFLNPINTFTKGLFLRNNQLTFDDLIQNLDVEKEDFSFRYVPQDTLDIVITGELALGQDFSFEVLIDDTHPLTAYNWYKDGQRVMNFNDKIYNVQSVLPSDIGRYYCVVTNEALPNLNLVSKSFGMPDPRLNDSLVLVDFYHAMSGEEWNNPWDLNLPMDQWKGVNLLQNRVAEIWLFRQNVSGIIPENFSELDKLNTLSLSNNALDSIPPVIGEIEFLNVLNLSYNNLKGEIPDWIYTMENLFELDISNNNLVGELSYKIKNLKHLWRLEIGNNSISGFLPDVWDQLPFLTNLDIALANISLPLPATLFELPDLTRLVVDDIPFNESFDERIWDFSSLIFLSAINCGLKSMSGDVSNLSMKTIVLRQNQFKIIPPVLYDISSLVSVNLAQNNIASLSEAGLEKLPELHTLSLNRNLIKSIPDWSWKTNWGTSAGQGLNLSNNLLTFAEIIKNEYLFVEEFSRNRYWPQLPANIDQFDEDIPAGASFIYQCEVDSSVSDITYIWVKNEDTISMEGSGILLLDPFSKLDTGTYHCVLTHPLWPKLKLRTTDFHLAYGVTTSNSDLASANVYLYPNPLIQTSLNIEFSESNVKVENLRLTHFSGSSYILDAGHWMQSGNSIEVRLNDLVSGHYILSVSLENGREIPLKFVKF